jgi:ribosomal protein S6--L-glutamate ligase
VNREGTQEERPPEVGGPNGRYNGAARVLVVEDDARIADFLVRGLSALGIELVVAQDTEVGEFLASTEAFDLVILDLGSPPGPGLQVLRLLRAEHPLMQVIAVTERDQPDSREAVLGAGAAACLTKPFVFEELCERVTELALTRSRHVAQRGIKITGDRTPAIWVLTDLRYLAQRMPLALADWLEAVGQKVHLAVADRGETVSCLAPHRPPPPSSPWDRIIAGDLVVARSRHPFALALLEEAEARGARTVNPASAVRWVRNKVRGTLALAEAGLPVPDTFVAQSPRELGCLPERVFPLVLKPFLGDNAEGIRVVRAASELYELEWQDPIVLAQPYIDAAGIDLKLYVAGETVWAVRRGSPLLDPRRAPSPASVDASLRDLALSCGATFGLRLYGLDVLESNARRTVVDVNEFPNYTGIDEAPAVIGRLLLGDGLGRVVGSAADPYT